MCFMFILLSGPRLCKIMNSCVKVLVSVDVF